LAIIATAGPLNSIALAPHGAKFAVSGADNLIHVYDLGTSKELQTVPGHTAAIGSLLFHADNRTLVSASADKSVRVSDVAALKILPGHTGGVTSAAFLPSGTQAVTGGADKIVRLWDVAAGKEIKAFPGATDVITGVALSREAAPTRIATSSADKTVRIWTI